LSLAVLLAPAEALTPFKNPSREAKSPVRIDPRRRAAEAFSL
jgi:hypothetical protein